MEQRSTPKLVLSHLLAMLVASMLTLALAGCGSDASAGSAAPRFAAAQDRTVPAAVVAAGGEIDLPLPQVAESSADVADESSTSERPSGPESRAVDGFAPASAIVVRRAMTALDVIDREPVDAGRVFSRDELEGERLYAFFDLANNANIPARLMVVFVSPDGGEHGLVELNIPARSPRWRTWAFTRSATEQGQWRIELRHLDGTTLSSDPFEIGPAGMDMGDLVNRQNEQDAMQGLQAALQDEYEPAGC